MEKINLTIILLFLNILANAQAIGGVSSNNGSKEAKKLVSEASKLWKQEKYTEAEKLYYKANTLSPGSEIILDLAKLKIELNDIKGADKVCEQGINTLIAHNTHLDPQTLIYEKMAIYFFKINNNLKIGDPATAVKDTKQCIDDLGKDFPGKVYENLLVDASATAFYLSDISSLQIFHSFVESMDMKRAVFVSDIYIKLSEKKYLETIKILKDAAENGAGFMFSKSWANSLLPLTYVLNGDMELSKVSMKGITKSILANDKFFSNELGLIALQNKDYPEAIKQFNISITPHNFLIGGRIEKPNKFAAYTNRAVAYEGLKDLLKARKDYEAALIYNPDYEPALNGLARLEGRVITERKTDKIPPVISITEPSVSRGLKVTSSGKDIMVKGLAKDASGLKSVSINGKAVYSKEEGDFWGSVQLQEGLNKLTIVATDMAGNTAEQTVEIEKQATPIVATADIIPVREKTGKNYAVFIASQNYDDSTIPSLENPISDAIKLKMILKNSYNFSEENILTLFNPERSDFRKKFIQLTEILQPEDNLIIFYAGHGVWVDKDKKGYWLLTDALRNDVNTWLPNKEVLDMIASVPSRHTLLITDACFSGSVFKSRGLGSDAPAPLREMDEKISRVAITSGNDTEVPDVSVFMKYLVKALSENKEKYLTAQKMFINQIIEAVMTESKTEPRYGTLELAGHVGGDFVFSKK
ncbi:MAG: Caspase protein [Daejeonella sp.]|nr:Caspase protein [Daejeonella sp.]